MAKDAMAIPDGFLENRDSATREVLELINKTVRVVSRSCHDMRQEDREDISTQVFTDVWRGCKKDPAAIKDFRAWVYGVANHRFIDWLRKARPKDGNGLQLRRLDYPEEEVEEEGDRLSRRNLAAFGEKDDRLEGRASRDEALTSKKRQLDRGLAASLDYIDLAYQIRKTYRQDCRRTARALRPLVEAGRKLSDIQKTLLKSLSESGAAPSSGKSDDIFSPMLAAVLNSAEKLDNKVRETMTGLSYAADDPDWPLDFNPFIGGVALMKLSPPTLIFRVWSKILKKPGEGKYTDYEYMRDRWSDFKARYKGTEREYLFRGRFEPKSLRIEQYKRSGAKDFYDRLADWIYKKAFEERLSLEEALHEEDAHVPVYHNRGLLVLPLSK